MYTKELLQDMRDLMYPYTAEKLKESKKNSIKDFLSVAGIFGVTHMMIFSQTDKSTYFRLIKNPKGPTITFKVDQYSLSKDVIKYQ
jgi:ribosome biogenesis protein SSF1/2